MDLNKPTEAREFLAEFRKRNFEGALSYVIIEGRRIEFATITDQDAVQVAKFLHAVELEGERLEAEARGHIH